MFINLPTSGMTQIEQACADVPGTKPTMQGGVLTCVPIGRPVQGGSFGSMNIFAGADPNMWLWIAGGALALILLASGGKGRRR